MKNRRLIFVTNDDSYLSKGFRAMVNLAREFGDVVAIAPDRVQSGMSQAITINSPLFLRTVEKSEGVEKPIFGVLTAILSIISIWTNFGVVATIAKVLGG